MDWTNIIRELRALGWTYASIAEEVHAGSASAINELAKGRTKEPQWPLGDALIALYSRETHPNREAA